MSASIPTGMTQGNETIESLRPFFDARSVVVVGVSHEPASVGYRLLETILHAGYRGTLFGVNPRLGDVLGLRLLPSVRALPAPVDLAIIAVPAPQVLSVVDDCAAHGIRAIVVISAGFAEVGADGARLQEQLLDKVRAHGMRMIGPNCLGIISTHPAVRLNATFTDVDPPPGPVAMSSDSGALSLAVLRVAKRLDVGISHCVSVGNRADVSSNDLLEFWEQDPGTEVILLYLESFGNPRRFARIARRASRHKPIIAVKAGRSSAGARAASSHTAALAVSDVAVDALFHQTGVLRAHTLQEMFDLALALAHQPLPTGKRVGILTNAGGPAILAADVCEAGGLILPELSAPLQAKLATFLPAAASRRNPVDMIATATPAQYAQVLEHLVESNEVDALIVMHIAGGLSYEEQIVQAIAQSAAIQARKMPILACWMADQPRSFLKGDHQKIPAYAFPEQAANVLNQMAAYADWRSQPLGETPCFKDWLVEEVQRICTRALADRGPGWLRADETRSILLAAGLPVAPGGIAQDADEAGAIARRFGFPVAVKLASHRIVHKTEIGGVHLALTDEAAVRTACAAIQRRLEADQQLDALEGFLVQPMIPDGVEVLVGMTHDPLFGPLLAFGLGGIHVEILRDVCFRVTPLTDRDAHDMVRSIRGFPLLQGYRGHPRADLAALEELLLRVSQLVEAVPQLREFEFNPVFALTPGQGCRIVDARVRVDTL